MTDADFAPRLRRILDEDPRLQRDPSHEISPSMPAPDKTPGDMIADKSLAILDEAASLTLKQLKDLKDQIEELEQSILNSQVHVREVVRTHMAIAQQAMTAGRLIAKQIADATQGLTARNGA